MRKRLLVMCILLPAFTLGIDCFRVQPKPRCADLLLDEENDYASEWDLLYQAEENVGDYDTDSERGWIQIVDEYARLRKCEPW